VFEDKTPEILRLRSGQAMVGRYAFDDSIIRPFDKLRVLTVRLRSLSLNDTEESEVEAQAHDSEKNRATSSPL
jgi:hypothetical protein